jgi:uncharacterized Zn finger protein
MRRLTHPERGLFPLPKEIKMSCSCPDWAVLCKHVAAVLYGVGARLDQEPQLLFLLRGVDHSELVSQAVSDGNLDSALSGAEAALAGEDLGAMFGIELDSSSAEIPAKAKSRVRRTPKTVSPTRSKRPTKKAVAVIVEKPAAKKLRSARLPAPAEHKQSAKPAKAKEAVRGEGAVAETKKATRRHRAAR